MKANFHCAHLHNLSPQGTGDVPTALLGAFFSKTYPSFLTLKEGSTSLSKPLPSQKGKDVPTALLGAQTASLYGWRTIRGLRQQRSCGFLCGDEPALLKSFLWERRDTMLDAVMIILFIRLWTGSTLERFPSGLWRKSCDLHWHLMNDISAYVLYQITQNANLNELILLRYCSYQTKSKVYHSLYGIPYSSSSYLSKDEDYILPVSDCLLPKA